MNKNTKFKRKKPSKDKDNKLRDFALGFLKKADFNIDDVFYLIYTDDSINNDGEIETYANEYEVIKGKIILKEINKEKLPLVYKKWDELCQEA